MTIKFLKIIAILFVCPIVLSAQDWHYIKTKDGIKLFSKQGSNSGIKYFKGVENVNIQADKLFAKLEDVHQTDWWTKDVTQIDIMSYEKMKRAHYYIVYHLPWPFKDRDVCVNVTVTTNKKTGEQKLTATPLPGRDENKNCIRVKEYWQEWRITPIDNRSSHIELEFYINPGTNLPDWIINMILKDSPINIIRAFVESF